MEIIKNTRNRDNIVGLLIAITFISVCFYTAIYVFSYSGYHVYGYIAGDENHTMYEDTIIWGDAKTVDVYSDSIQKANGYAYTIMHFDPVNRISCPETKRVTLDNIKPRFIARPEVHNTTPKVENTTPKDTIKSKPNIKKEEKSRDLHIRTNGSVDIGNDKPGSINYNVKTGRFGIRTSKYTVIDSKGIHFSF